MSDHIFCFVCPWISNYLYSYSPDHNARITEKNILFSETCIIVRPPDLQNLGKPFPSVHFVKFPYPFFMSTNFTPDFYISGQILGLFRMFLNNIFHFLRMSIVSNLLETLISINRKMLVQTYKIAR